MLLPCVYPPRRSLHVPCSEHSPLRSAETGLIQHVNDAKTQVKLQKHIPNIGGRLAHAESHAARVVQAAVEGRSARQGCEGMREEVEGGAAVVDWMGTPT